MSALSQDSSITVLTKNFGSSGNSSTISASYVVLCIEHYSRRLGLRGWATPASSLFPIQGGSLGAAAREGEVLIRFRANASEHDKAAVVTGHGAQREKLRGESGIEKLKAPSGESVESLAAQLML